MKPIVTLFAAMLFTMTFQAQVGIGTTTPQAALDIVSATNGLLIPRVALTAENISAPVVTISNGELVYNTATVGTLTPGFYYWNVGIGSWIRIGDTVTPPPPPPSFGGWLLAGNVAVAADFVGTTNDVDLVFRRGGLLSGRIGFTNTYFGRLAGNANTSGSNNTYFGANAGALLNSSSAQNNVAIGTNALQGNANRVISNSTAVGTRALENPNSNSNGNTAIGYQAGSQTTSGSNNVMVGNDSRVSTGSNSVAIGFGAAAATFSNSVALGSGALNTASDQVRLGNASVTSVVTSGVVTAPSYIATVGPLTGYADYVFEDYFKGVSKINSKYKFNTLEEAEDFVMKNGHLPGVKSYAQVMKNGFNLNLTDATITNLEKLEEQFLYITELNKKINTQENKIHTQTQKIKALEARLERIERLLKD